MNKAIASSADERRKLRWPRFSLRTMLAVVFVLCIAFGWISLKLQQARHQSQVVKEIYDLGGDVLYAPGWKGLRKLVGDDLIVNVSSVFFNLHNSEQITEQITDADIALVTNLAGLTYLNLNDTRVTNDCLKYVAQLTMLDELQLERTKVTDAGLIHLKGLSRLELLTLEGAPIAGPGLRHLEGLGNLKELYLSDTLVDDAGLAQVGHLVQLRALYLNNTRVSDAGLLHLQNLRNLEFLNLDFTQITDAGLTHLTGLTKLKSLSASNTVVSREAAVKFEERVPGVTVTGWGP